MNEFGLHASLDGSLGERTGGPLGAGDGTAGGGGEISRVVEFVADGLDGAIGDVEGGGGDALGNGGDGGGGGDPLAPSRIGAGPPASRFRGVHLSPKGPADKPWHAMVNFKVSHRDSGAV